MFVNTLALRSQVEGDDTVAALLAKVKATCLEAYEHQDAPFEKVVDLVRPHRNLAISPLFQVMVILQNVETGTPDPQIQLYPLDSGISKFDLTVAFTDTPAGLAGSIEYSTALYTPQTIARMVEHLTALCQAMTDAPAARVRDLEYLGATEKQRLLVAYNDTDADYPHDQCLHDLFVEQAARAGEHTAVVCGDERLTYRELQAKSQDLARYLQSQGVGPDGLVALCMDRSLDMVVGLLGILQAGGAYVPLDPAYPDDRLAYMLRDSRASIVLTQASLEGKLRAVLPADTWIVALDRQWAEIADCVAVLHAKGVALRQDVTPQHLAYVIYTSGSTGQPKGVAIEHHSPVTLVQWARDVYSREELAGVLASTSICFDLSIYELFVTLAAGGTVILVPNALGADQSDEHRRRHAHQHRAVRDGGTGAGGRDSRVGAHHQPGRRAVVAGLGGQDLRHDVGDECLRPLRAVRRYDVFDVCPTAETGAANHWPADREHAGLHSRSIPQPTTDRRAR